MFVLSGLSLALLSGRFEISEALPIIFSLVFVVVTIILMSYNNIILSLEENAKQEILISKYELQSAYYQDMKKYMDSFRSLRHDFKNHLIILNTYAEQNDTEKLQNYLNKITDTLTDASVIQTPHDLISAILNTKALACREKKINFQQNCYFSDINISDYHLIKILGNILDNAITAAGKLENGFISFSMEQSDTYLHITCENNHKEKIIKKDGHFVTTKENANMFHGLGIKNIQSSIDELNGTLDIDYDDSMFTVSILIPNYY
ncbi:MAG: GHKL domain-containing protein [Lachnospiraceae bacterium]|nr:GHKL domain-containing protein [Lachnospiraceae bacterium]